LRKVTTDIERFTFNTAVAALMELSNTLAAYRRDGARTETWDQAIDLLALMLAPMAPHLAHEVWERAGHDSLLAEEAWPQWDPDLVVEQTVTMVVQVNGKVRDRIEVPADISDEDATALALTSERVAKYLDGGEPSRVVVRPPHVVNVVV
jgi:leucyl-tRNA synthetase